MTRLVLLSLIVAASLSTIVGCGSTSQGARSPDTRDEACWTPPGEPGEIAMSIKDAPKASAANTTPSEGEKMKTSYRPNRQERPTSGAVHAATY